MFQLSPVFLAFTLGLFRSSLAQFAPPTTYNAVLKSPINPNITISYKTPQPSVCTTAFDPQKQYSGYATIPLFTIAPYQQNYTISTFFWFFEARSNPETAPLTIWLNSGPGSSGMVSLFREVCPCEVFQRTDGSYEAQPNVWGWEHGSNLLFIDQPMQVGFSYDEAVNVTTNLCSGNINYEPKSRPEDGPTWSVLNATLLSGLEDRTQNSTVIAASTAWHFLQGFLSAFPQYNPGQHFNSTAIKPTGISLFTESYSGQYGPTFADYFEDQNELRHTGMIPTNSTLRIKLATLRIFNGLVDVFIQSPSMLSFVHDNSYDLRLIDQTAYLNLLSGFRAPNGCEAQIKRCDEQLLQSDRSGETRKFDDTSSAACARATAACDSVIEELFTRLGRSLYDIHVKPPSSFPSYAYLEHLNSTVQESIRARINYSKTNPIVHRAFASTGDLVRGTQLKKLAGLLERDVRVALIYGHADIICNWYGGEAVVLELSRISSYNSSFPSAGFSDIVANASCTGGHVRQLGDLSFARIFGAGHTVPLYQPETALVVFSRIIHGDDISMECEANLSSFSTHGPARSLHRNKVPRQSPSTCWIRSISETCTSEERASVYEGLGFVKNGIWHAQHSESPSANPSFHVSTTAVQSAPTTVDGLTGAYTAAPGSATMTSGGPPLRLLLPLHRLLAQRDRDEGVKYWYDDPDSNSDSSSDEEGNHKRIEENSPQIVGWEPPKSVVKGPHKVLNETERERKRKKRIRLGLLGGIASGLVPLLMLGALFLLIICCRRIGKHRRDRDAQRSEKLPAQTADAPAPAVPPTEKPAATPRKNSFLRPFVHRHRRGPLRQDVERPPLRPVAQQPRPNNAPMEPIPKATTARRSMDVPRTDDLQPPIPAVLATPAGVI